MWWKWALSQPGGDLLTLRPICIASMGFVKSFSHLIPNQTCHIDFTTTSQREDECRVDSLSVFFASVDSSYAATEAGHSVHNVLMQSRQLGLSTTTHSICTSNEMQPCIGWDCSCFSHKPYSFCSFILIY